MAGNEIGSMIRALRSARKLSQARLAGLAEIDPSYFAKVERGASEPSLTILDKVAKALGMRLIVNFVEVAPGERAFERRGPAVPDGMSGRTVMTEREEQWVGRVIDFQEQRAKRGAPLSASVMRELMSMRHSHEVLTANYDALIESVVERLTRQETARRKPQAAENSAPARKTAGEKKR